MAEEMNGNGMNWGYTPVEHEDTNRYATHGTGTAGITLGSVALGLIGAQLLGNGGLGNLFGTRPMGPAPDFLPRTEAVLMQELASKNADIARLEAQSYTTSAVDAVRKELQAQITINKDLQANTNLTQATLNATQAGLIAGLQAQLAQLQSCFHMMIPGSNVVPETATASTQG